MSAMRRGIAEHMHRSLDTAAHVTSAIEVDMSKVVTIRQTLKAIQESYGVNLTYSPSSRATVRRCVVAVRERRDQGRVDRDPQLRQPRLRGRARRIAKG
jgi:pyruvate/2-oxoglutarate dehydrogenase complex dihydrolipoamide acyltransferase (E2) component